MKKIMLAFLVATVVLATGCLKDNVDQPNPAGSTSPKGVYFTKSNVSVGLTADATPQTISTVYVSLSSATAPTSPVTTTIVSSPDKVPSTLTVLPASAFTFASSVVEAGKMIDTLAVTLLDASSLDPNIQYGIALTLTSTDNGFQIAENSKTVLLTISIKNKYDGKYSMRGRHNRSPNNFPYSGIEMDLETTGPSSVAYYFVDWGDYAAPIGVAAGVGSYGSGIAPIFTFDPATNNIVSIANKTPGVSLFLGPDPGRWDPVTKTIYAQWYYTTAAGQDFSNRGWSDTLTYVGPR